MVPIKPDRPRMVAINSSGRERRVAADDIVGCCTPAGITNAETRLTWWVERYSEGTLTISRCWEKGYCKAVLYKTVTALLVTSWNAWKIRTVEYMTC
jgi:hypothetical protein